MRSAGRSSSKPVNLRRFLRVDHGRDRLHPRARPAYRMRAASRRNNVFVSATNQAYSPLDYLDDFPLEQVGEIHLAGHAEQADDEGDLLLIDSP